MAQIYKRPKRITYIYCSLYRYKKISLGLLWILCFAGIKTCAQSYYINNGFNNGGTITTCSGSFYDSNPFGAYGANENYTVTFCSGSGSKVIQAVFSTLNIAPGDTLFCYDGNSINAHVIDSFTNVNQNQVYITPSLSNTRGCLTFRFVSDNLYQNNGWKAQIKCIFPCAQAISGKTISTPAKDVNGYTNVCFGTAAAFKAITSYPENNATYHQADSTSVFHWFFGDGKDTLGKNLLIVNHVYGTAGGFYARLIITDSNGCNNKTHIEFPVRTSLKPYFNIAQPASICLFDTTQIQPAFTNNGLSSVEPIAGSFVNFPVSGDSTFVPDQPPLCKTTTIVIDQFAPNQTLADINDLLGITMNMEHSYLGDLTISITAPNGVKVFLKKTVQGSANDGTFLGEPVDESLWGAPTNAALENIRGKGYDYTFNSTPTYGTMWSEVSKYAYTYTDNAGQQVNDHFYLPAGSYASEESLSSLTGTPLNGSWTLEICDKQAIDNGFLFNWKIDFKQTLYPNAETYTVPIVSQTWLPAYGLIAAKNTTAIVSPATSGNFKYTYRVKDAFGCTFDSLIHLAVNSLPAKPNLGKDTTICSGKSLTLQVLNADIFSTFSWSTNETGISHITINNPGDYSVRIADSSGCKNGDTIRVIKNFPFTLNVVKNTLFCASKPTALTPSASANIVSWQWSTGETTPAYTPSAAGTFWVEAKDAQGCTIRDTINVSDNPVNLLYLPADTSLCDKSSFIITVNAVAGTNITWNDYSTGFTHLVNQPVTYALSAEYLGCLHSAAMMVTNRPLPVFNLGKDTAICYGFGLTLNATYPGAEYRWSTGATDSVIVAATSGAYWAEAKLNGCFYRDTVIMSQKQCLCEIQLPNAFSPNGDGINDFYRPVISCFPENYHLSVFNRNGQIVFDTKDYKAAWDGKFNGNVLPVATYYYLLTFFNQSLMQVEKKAGSITLLR